MATFKAYLKKEILESIRQYRYVTLAAGILFFSISGPLLLKLTPEILKSQMGGADLSSYFTVDKLGAMQSLVGDMFEICNLFVIFSLCGILSDELTTQKFIFPYAKGSKPSGIVLSKALHYGIVTLLITITGFFACYYYSDILFKGEGITLSNILISALLVSLYFFFNIMLTMFFSSIIKKGIITGIVVLGISYFSPILNNIKGLSDFLPYKLLDLSKAFNSIESVKTIAVIGFYCVILGAATIYRMGKVEVV